MKIETVRELILNASLLLSISIMFNAFFTNLPRKKVLHNIILGILIGSIGILLIMNTVKLSTGIIFDKIGRAHV